MSGWEARRKNEGMNGWEARRRNEGCSLPGLSAVGHIKLVLHHQLKLDSLTHSQDLWLPTVMPMATAVLGPIATSEWCLTPWKPFAVFCHNCWRALESHTETGIRQENQ